MEQMYEIQLDSGTRISAVCDEALSLNPGDTCVFRKDFFLDSGRVIRKMPSCACPCGRDNAPETHEAPPPVRGRNTERPRIQRVATEADLARAAESRGRCKYILRTTQEYVNRLALPMKLINAHNSLDGKMVTIQFSADGRVDFRELVKLLSSEFNIRIELHQIGVRDETAIVGGISMCGRPLCCCQFLHDFASINVKMAKEQDLSLTPSTISGICGRLKCCLKFEHEGYLELEKTMPRRGELCECPDGTGRITDRNLLTQKVVVLLDGTGRSVTYPREEITVIHGERGGGIRAANPRSASNAPRNPARGTYAKGASSSKEAPASSGMDADPGRAGEEGNASRGESTDFNS